jgi:hypothetical protein
MLNHRVFNNWIKSVLIKEAIRRIRSAEPNLKSTH